MCPFHHTDKRQIVLLREAAEIRICKMASQVSSTKWLPKYPAQNGFPSIQHIFTNTHKKKGIVSKRGEMSEVRKEFILPVLFFFRNGKWQVCASYSTAIQVSMLIFFNITKLGYNSRLLVLWRTFVDLGVDVWVSDRRRVSLLCKTRRKSFTGSEQRGVPVEAPYVAGKFE